MHVFFSNYQIVSFQDSVQSVVIVILESVLFTWMSRWVSLVSAVRGSSVEIWWEVITAGVIHRLSIQ